MASRRLRRARALMHVGNMPGWSHNALATVWAQWRRCNAPPRAAAVHSGLTWFDDGALDAPMTSMSSGGAYLGSPPFAVQSWARHVHVGACACVRDAQRLCAPHLPLFSPPSLSLTPTRTSQKDSRIVLMAMSYTAKKMHAMM